MYCLPFSFFLFFSFFVLIFYVMDFWCALSSCMLSTGTSLTDVSIGLYLNRISAVDENNEVSTFIYYPVNKYFLITYFLFLAPSPLHFVSNVDVLRLACKVNESDRIVVQMNGVAPWNIFRFVQAMNAASQTKLLIRPAKFFFCIHTIWFIWLYGNERGFTLGARLSYIFI